MRENTVAEFEEGRLIAWRWELESINQNWTRVTHTYDWTELTDRSRFPRARATTVERLSASLERLAQIAENDGAG